MLKRQATSTTIAIKKDIATTIRELDAQRAEAANRDSRKYRGILKRFDLLPGENPDSLLRAVKDQVLTRLELEETGALLGAHRLPRSRDKVGPPPVLLTFRSIADRARFFARRKKLEGSPWSLDDDLTPAQQQQRRDQWPDFIRHKTSPEKPKAFWRGGDLYLNGTRWQPPRAPPG